MDEILSFLEDNSVFYFATMNGDRPAVRPFGLMMEYKGRLTLCTGNQKEVYQQLMKNPNFEICSAPKDGKWLRIKGKAEFKNACSQAFSYYRISP